MSIAYKIAAEHHYHPGVPVGQDCVCGEPQNILPDVEFQEGNQ